VHFNGAAPHHLQVCVRAGSLVWQDGLRYEVVVTMHGRMPDGPSSSATSGSLAAGTWSSHGSVTAHGVKTPLCLCERAMTQSDCCSWIMAH